MRRKSRNISTCSEILMCGWLEKHSDLLAKIAVIKNFANNLNVHEPKSKPRYNVIKGRHG